MQIILFLLFSFHSVAAIDGFQNNVNNQPSSSTPAKQQPIARPGTTGYRCNSKQGIIDVKLTDIKAAILSACQLSKQKGRYTAFPTTFSPAPGQILDYNSQKYYINPANALKYPDLYIIMTKECRLAGMMTTMGKAINGLPKLHYDKTIEVRSINSVSRENHIALRKRLVKDKNLLSCQIQTTDIFSQRGRITQNHNLPIRSRNLAYFAA